MSDDSKRNRPSGENPFFNEFSKVFGGPGHRDSGPGHGRFFGASKKASSDRPTDAGSAESTTDVRYYRAPCPHCGHEHTVKFKGRPGKTYQFECTACGEPFAWMPTKAARLPDENPADTADTENETGNAEGVPGALAVRATWWTGLAVGAAMALMRWPERMLPDDPNLPGSIRLFGEYFTHKEAVGIGLFALLLVGNWLLALGSTNRQRPAPWRLSARALIIGLFLTYAAGAISLTHWSLAAEPLYAVVGTATVWGTGFVVLGGALFVAARRWQPAGRWSGRLVRTAVPLIVLGAMGLVTHVGAFSADPPLPQVQAYTAGRQLDAAREAAATASTEAERERADEMFSEAGVNASRSGDLDRLEEALDAHIEFAEE